MSQPGQAQPTGRIRSEYTQRTPPAVAEWEKWANEAPTTELAIAQLLYHQLLQLRLIKLILGWALLVIPAIVAIVMIVLANTTDFGGTSSGF